MAKIIIAAADQSGHRREYIALFRRLFEGAGVPSTIRPLSWKDALGDGVLFSPMVEEYSLKFMLVAAIRGLMGRRSVGLLFRPGETVHSHQAKHIIKCFGLRILRLLPLASILTILPFEIDPAFALVAKDWIYDPQLWDLTEDTVPADPSLGAAARQAAAGRRVIVALGAQNTAKGFDYLVEIWGREAAIRQDALFVAAGKVSVESIALAGQFEAEGGMLVNRFVSDEELRGLYDAADLIWSCYAPFYDQASGIFGRAVQLGKPAIVRAGSQVGQLAETLKHPTIAIPWADSRVAAELMLGDVQSSEPASVAIADLRSRSIEALGRALGIEFGALA